MLKQVGSLVDMKTLPIVLVKQCQNDHHGVQNTVIRETPGRISAIHTQENKPFQSEINQFTSQNKIYRQQEIGIIFIT